MKTKKGSTLIYTLITTAFILTILSALLTMTTSSIKNVNKYNNINSAYYAGKSGVERTLDLLKNSTISKDLNNINMDGDYINIYNIKLELDGLIKQCIYNVKNEQTAKGYGGETGVDKIIFMNFKDCTAYYSIESLDTDTYNSSCSYSDKDPLIYKIPIKMQVKGYFNRNSKVNNTAKVNYNFDIIINYNVKRYNKSYKLIMNSWSINTSTQVSNK